MDTVLILLICVHSNIICFVLGTKKQIIKVEKGDKIEFDAEAYARALQKYPYDLSPEEAVCPEDVKENVF
jgi:hypothetical protein